MSTSDLIQPTHLQRRAVIYVRQSSPNQVINNQESTRLQYALKKRAIERGWHERDTLIIDTDLGRTGSTTVDRPGFQEMVALVSLGQVGTLIDKVVLHRIATDQVRVRVVWRGGQTTTVEICVPVSSFARLSDWQQIQDTVAHLVHEGQTDEQIAAVLTANGHRAPMRGNITVATVRKIRFKNRVLRYPKKSRPCHKVGYLTIAQLAEKLKVTYTKIYWHILDGTINVKKDENTKCYLFPDKPSTMAQIRQLLEGTISQVELVEF